MPIQNKRTSKSVNKLLLKYMEKIKEEIPNEKQRFDFCVKQLTN